MSQALVFHRITCCVALLYFLYTIQQSEELSVDFKPLNKSGTAIKIIILIFK